ncbi:MAG: branched-chain amino acid ABC transporter permease [Haloarculaceae archaeon]
MDLTGTRMRRAVVERPGLVVVTLLGVLLFLDLVRRVATGQQGIAQLVGFLWDGTVIGLVIGLAGIGLSLTYSILNFANFSHGDIVTVGGYVGWATTFAIAGFGTANFGDLVLLGASGGVSPRSIGVTVTTTPLAVVAGLVVATVAAAAVALALDRVVYRPMRDASGISLLIASIGVALALRYAVVFVWDASPQGLTAASDILSVRIALPGGHFTLGAHQVTLVVMALLLMAGLHLLLQFTKLGTAMRAMADNKDLARVTGIPTERVIRLTWIVGGGLAGAAGYLAALERGTIAFNLGWLLLLLIFAAVILGGIGSVYGAMVGGLAIGVVSRVSLVWIPADFGNAAAFLIMILILLFRPQGIFGGVETA